METTRTHRILVSCFCIVTAIVLFLVPVKTVPLVDSRTADYFSEALTRAGLAYATARAINASVSVIKESNLQLEPAGIGVSLAAGQMLDPVDDLTERLSSVLVTAITSLGVQKLFYEIGIFLAPAVAAALLLIFSALVWFGNPQIESLQKAVVRLIIVVAALRFCLPVSSYVNAYVNDNFFNQRIEKVSSELRILTREFNQLENLSLPESTGIIDVIENSGSLIKQKIQAFKKALQASVINMTAIIDNLLELTFLYVSIFFVQVMIIPLLMLWIIVKIAGTLFQLKQN
jgi:hypothetical protein